MTTTTPQPAASTTEEAIDVWPAESMKALKGEWGQLRCRFINSHPTGRWDDFILSEWELEACAWEDFHPHSETAYVLEGELHIESDGKTVILKPGDSARVNPGRLGRYSAPVYARMVTIYGPNPEGAESHSFRYSEI
ncbi:cupin domain-containing protein [Arthrobacter sp. H35-D1]|uniref:cupin domain-containing protein n=1 Tax=Arthrobacter sp. H35-D1 TaxID=3046202 RepID=UPI0024BA5F4D|nr:cupin domain-containing protein [Arthrobacter sp. H35-D1]MDJ0315466.1 cupin domain-containing protein [Arthrobacter sp. H35-D1]